MFIWAIALTPSGFRLPKGGSIWTGGDRMKSYPNSISLEYLELCFLLPPFFKKLMFILILGLLFQKSHMKLRDLFIL